MRNTLRIALSLAVLALPAAAIAQSQVALPTQTTADVSAVAPQGHALTPFVAQYKVVRGGVSLGQATLQVHPTQGNRWQADLRMRGTGVMSLVGIHIDSSSVFDLVGERFRPISQATTRRASLFGSKQAVGIYDWTARTAKWSGDVKEARRRPVALQDGDLNGLLINLAVVRDARPGAALSYRFVDEVRVRNHQYRVASAPEVITVNGLEYQTYRVTRTDAGHTSDETVLWVVPGGDTPIRMLQREDGKDMYDLQLLEYQKGATP
jgi:hypothetical protein